ncbi:MAG: hypothetical protein IJT36_05680 [Alphaproteobacteria bacterium]|nr:hypothetical protein [Alphaproteobacteria bacterium]
MKKIALFMFLTSSVMSMDFSSSQSPFSDNTFEGNFVPIQEVIFEQEDDSGNIPERFILFRGNFDDSYTPITQEEIATKIAPKITPSCDDYYCSRERRHMLPPPHDELCKHHNNEHYRDNKDRIPGREHHSDFRKHFDRENRGKGTTDLKTDLKYELHEQNKHLAHIETMLETILNRSKHHNEHYVEHPQHHRSVYGGHHDF